MELLINNLEQELFNRIQMCKEKIIIISPFISLNVAEHLVEIVKAKNVTCKIVTRFERKSFIENASSIEALKIFIENDIQIFALKDLHSKVYLIDDTSCFAGSVNFTNKGLNINHEILMYFNKENEIKIFDEYVNELIEQVKNWQITMELIEKEQEFIDGYKEKEKITYSWGADIKTEEIFDENAKVLSVPAGDTIHLIDKYFVHAHPISSGYNYSSTEYIAFRKKNGGVMEKIFRISETFVVEMNKWESVIEKIDVSDIIKNRITNYIIDRYRDFEFDKAPKYKFYILSLICNLPNEPHPPVNNPGGWIYTIKDLKESTGIVYTIKQKKKNN
ncbi:phospholipase D-like domain-containing protein [Lysinibacillus endophyticus]|uniref:phospholipase D-like domain-containing protein n=1 Tax=Ureibacillus endophyticus TaxID=1978490 RepID=UPI0020A12B2F|nr:phospholipase D-like domain-containing protein [Lysinibacillus endophyticus]MCP1144876.1 phospholipase D-like domain-containing protein [Lysinibacillus endophyticus]